MNTLIKSVFVSSLLLLLTACETDQKMKVQFEPTLPVPFLIVPDEGATNNPNNNNQNYAPPPQYNPPPQYTPPPQNNDSYQRNYDKNRKNYNLPPHYEEDEGYRGYRN